MCTSLLCIINQFKRNIIYVLGNDTVSRINTEMSLNNTGRDPSKMNVIVLHGLNGMEQHDKFNIMLRNGNIHKLYT